MKQKFTLIFSFLLITTQILFSVKSVRAEVSNQIVVTGKVITSTHGNPLVGHKVYIINDSLATGELEYYKELTTDEYGFYYDTISTNFKHGSIVVYTYDYKHIIASANVHFRFLTEENDNVFINDFSIFMPYMTPHLQARFKHEQDTLNNRFEFAFFDETDNEQILSRIWDFGDQSASNLENPIHVYKEPGFYRVNLTITAVVDNRTETNTITKFIFIPVHTYFDLGGNCFADLFPIQKGMIYLYKKDSSNLVWPIDTASVNELGIYYFYQVPIGEYTLKLQPANNSPEYGAMMPTYYGNKLFWNEASFFKHDKKNYNYDISLQEGLGIENGEGSISGVVTADDILNTLLTTTVNVDVYLSNTSGDLLASHYTDDNSEFLFDNIAYGTYYITPEITGIPRNETRIIISEDLPEVSTISINAETGEVTLDILETMSMGSIEVSDPYPNPASNQVSIRLNADKPGDAVIDVIDLQGRIVHTSTKSLNANNNEIKLSTSNLENGIYFIRMQADRQFSQHKFIVSR